MVSQETEVQERQEKEIQSQTAITEGSLNMRSDLAQKVFGKLTALELVGRDKSRNVVWACACSCGRTVKIRGLSLVRGNSTSCGRCVDKKGSKNGSHKLTEQDVLVIKDLVRGAHSDDTAISKTFGVCRSTIALIRLGHTWSHVKEMEVCQ